MASGDSLLSLNAIAFVPYAGSPSFTSRNRHALWQLDAAGREDVSSADLVLPQNFSASGGLTIVAAFTAASATTGNAIVAIAIEQVTGLDIDGDSFAAEKTATYTAPGTSGVPATVSISFTNAEADSVTTGNVFRIRVGRDGANVSDTMAGDLELLSLSIRET